ncbi:hypothetical protein ACSSS7_001829 [Eimeria intestinalis]
MLSASGGGGNRQAGPQASYNEARAATAAPAGVSGTCSSNSNNVNGSSAENPWMELRILSLGSGPSLHARGGAAAAGVAAGCTYIATVDGSLIRTEGEGHQIQLIDFPAAKDQLQLRRLFVSPSGSHLLAAAANGVTVYVHRKARSALLLQRLKGKIIECVAWRAEADSGAFLVGPALRLWICVQSGSEAHVAVLVATDKELLCFLGIGSIASAFSSGSTNKNVHAAVSDAVAYEVSPGSVAAAASAAPSCLAADRNSSKDPQTASFTVYWLTPYDFTSFSSTLEPEYCYCRSHPFGRSLGLRAASNYQPLNQQPIGSWNSTSCCSCSISRSCCSSSSCWSAAFMGFRGECTIGSFVVRRRVGLLIGGLLLPSGAAASGSSGNLLSFPPVVMPLPSAAVVASASSNNATAAAAAAAAPADPLNPQPGPVPLAFASTARHFLLLYEHCVIAYSKISKQYSMSLALPQHLYGKALQLLHDSSSSCTKSSSCSSSSNGLLLLTTEFAASLLLQHEEANVWRLLLARRKLHDPESYGCLNRFPSTSSLQILFGANRGQVFMIQRGLFSCAEDFAGALATCFTTHQREVVLRGRAQQLLDQQEWVAAAAALASCCSQLNEADAAALRGGSPAVPSPAAANSAVATEDTGKKEAAGETALREAMQRTQQEIRRLLSEFKHVDELHASCADAIPAIQNVEARNHLFVSYAPVLFLQRPQHFVAAAKSPELAALDPWRLLPALLLPVALLQHEKQQHQQQLSTSRSYACWGAAVQLVKHFADAYGPKNGLTFPFAKASSSSVGGLSSGGSNCSSSNSWASPTGVGTALLLLLAEAPDNSEEELANAVTTLASSHEAVRMALHEADLPLAEEAAASCGDEVLRRSLWLQICRYVAEREDVGPLLALVERSRNCIKIQDLLPLLPDSALLRDVAPALRVAAAAAQRNSSNSTAALQQHLAAIKDLKDQLQAVNQK